MKKSQFALLASTILLSAFIVIYGCKKEGETEEFDTQIPQDNALAEATFNDVMEISNQAIDNQGSGLSTYRLTNIEGSLLSNCATVTITPDSIGQGGTLTVDFDSIPCACSDGRYRKGIINVAYTGSYRDSGAVITCTFQNYYVGKESTFMYKVTGSKTVTNKGQNNLGHSWYSIDVNGQLQNKNGATLSWTSQRQREWIEGESTQGFANWADDVYSITGTASGTTFEGKSYTATITKALRIALNCSWIEEGTFELTPSGLATRVFDYGTTGCDNKASVDVNGAHFDITLR